MKIMCDIYPSVYCIDSWAHRENHLPDLERLCMVLMDSHAAAAAAVDEDASSVVTCYTDDAKSG